MFCRIKACGGLLKSGGRFVWYERGDCWESEGGREVCQCEVWCLSLYVDFVNEDKSVSCSMAGCCGGFLKLGFGMRVQEFESCWHEVRVCTREVEVCRICV